MAARENIAALRSAMKDAHLDGYLIPSSDPHMSEYLPAHYTARAWASGFTGSVGTLAITADKAALWVDGRYFVQAEKQLAGSGITLMRIAVKGTPEIPDWIAENLPENGVLGLDGLVTAHATVQTLEKAFANKNITIDSLDLVSPLWSPRPELPSTKAWLLEVKYAGKSAAEKLAQIRADLAVQNANGLLISRLDSVAWLLNLRAADLTYSPFAMAYCLVLPSSTTVFIDKTRVSANVENALEKEGISVAPYGLITTTLLCPCEPVTLLYEAAGTSETLYRACVSNENITLLAGSDPIVPRKGVKNDVEIACLKKSHAKDGVAMVRFAMALENDMAAGNTLSEWDIVERMTAVRAAQEDNIGESFDTIAAYGANAAMMHYSPSKTACATLEPHGFLLVDCGGQYLDGTTDITRTYALGTLTDEEKMSYTLVLKSHIGIARAVFMEGCTGGNLDILARGALWQHGIDYRCGTGHGVGFVGGVHEGPQNLRINNNTKFEAGMTVTDEPGIYTEGEIGIRIENELLCKEWGTTEYGRFLCFEPFTYCPIETKAVLVEMLNADEKEWLNHFHQTVFDTLKGALDEDERAWLANACKAI